MSGAIRWADATLFITQATQMESESDEQDLNEQVYPVLTDKSDIYSFGSVTLEVGVHFLTIYTLSNYS